MTNMGGATRGLRGFALVDILFGVLPLPVRCFDAST